MSITGLITQIGAQVGLITGPPYNANDVQTKVATAIYNGAFDMDAMIYLELATANSTLFTTGNNFNIPFDTRRSTFDKRASVFSWTPGTGLITINETGFYEEIIGHVWASNGTGNRLMYSSTPAGREAFIEAPAAGGANFTVGTASKIVRIGTAGTVLTVQAGQSSGVTLTLNGAGFNGNTFISLRKVGNL